MSEMEEGDGLMELPPPIFPRTNSTYSVNSISSSSYDEQEYQQEQEEAEGEEHYDSAKEVFSRGGSGSGQSGRLNGYESPSNSISSRGVGGEKGVGGSGSRRAEIMERANSSSSSKGTMLSPNGLPLAYNHSSTNRVLLTVSDRSASPSLRKSNNVLRRSGEDGEVIRRAGVLSERSQRKIDEINTSPVIPSSSTFTASPSTLPPPIATQLPPFSPSPISPTKSLLENGIEPESERARRVRTLGNASGSIILEQRKEKDSLSPGGKNYLRSSEVESFKEAIPISFNGSKNSTPSRLGGGLSPEPSGSNLTPRVSVSIIERRSRTPDLFTRRAQSVLSSTGAEKWRERGSSYGTDLSGNDSVGRNSWSLRRKEKEAESNGGIREREWSESLSERERKDDIFKNGLDRLSRIGSREAISTPPTSVRVSERGKRFGNGTGTSGSSNSDQPTHLTGTGGLERDLTLKAINKLLVTKGLVASEIPNSAPSRLGGNQNGSGVGIANGGWSRRRASSISELEEDFTVREGGNNYISPNRVRSRATTSFGNYGNTGRESRASVSGIGNENHHSLLFQALDSFDRQFKLASDSSQSNMTKRMEALVGSTTKLNSGVRLLLQETLQSDYWDSVENGRTSRAGTSGIGNGRALKEVLRGSDDQIRSLTEVLIALTKEERERSSLNSTSTRVSSRMGLNSNLDSTPSRSYSRMSSLPGSGLGRSGSVGLNTSRGSGGFSNGIGSEAERKKDLMKSPLIVSPIRELTHRRSRTSSSSISSLSAVQISPSRSPSISLFTTHAVTNNSPTAKIGESQIPFPTTSNGVIEPVISGMERLSLDSLEGRGTLTPDHRTGRRGGSSVKALEEIVSPVNYAREERRKAVEGILRRGKP